MTSFVDHLKRQIAWSRATFGPGARTEGVLDHIRKELDEIQEAHGDPAEWVDVAILALDGLWRSLKAVYPHLTTDEIAKLVFTFIVKKQAKNEERYWPDWRTADPDKAIEHDRSEREAAR